MRNSKRKRQNTNDENEHEIMIESNNNDNVVPENVSAGGRLLHHRVMQKACGLGRAQSFKKIKSSLDYDICSSYPNGKNSLTVSFIIGIKLISFNGFLKLNNLNLKNLKFNQIVSKI